MTTPAPYTVEFFELKFGTWKFDVNEYREPFDRRLDSLDSDSKEYRQVLHETAMACHKARLNFKQKKLQYTMSISHPRGDRGQIEIDFDQITGLEFTPNSYGEYKMTVQLSSPATCHIGKKVPGPMKPYRSSMLYTQRIDNKFEKEQCDFSSGGQIKKSRTHCLVISSANVLQTMKTKLAAAHPGLAAAIAAGITSTTRFTAAEVQASLGAAETATTTKKEASKKRAAPGNENEISINGASSSRPRAEPKKPSS
jgi:hypothetical protein